MNVRLVHVRQRADRFNAIGRPKSQAGERAFRWRRVVNTLKESRLACPKGERDLVFPNGRGNVEMLSNIWRRGLAPVQMAAGLTEPIGKVDESGEAILRTKYGLHTLRSLSRAVSKAPIRAAAWPIRASSPAASRSRSSSSFGNKCPYKSNVIWIDECPINACTFFGGKPWSIRYEAKK